MRGEMLTSIKVSISLLPMLAAMLILCTRAARVVVSLWNVNDRAGRLYSLRYIWETSVVQGGTRCLNEAP